LGRGLSESLESIWGAPGEDFLAAIRLYSDEWLTPRRSALSWFEKKTYKVVSNIAKKEGGVVKKLRELLLGYIARIDTFDPAAVA
jgi:hypothetical protein